MKKIYLFLTALSFSAFAQPGVLCTDPIVITSLPYSTTDNTSNYGDDYNPPTGEHPECSTTLYGNYYHTGDDVIYSFTPSANGTVKFELPNAVGWSGMFLYTSCDDIGVTYAACATGVSAGTRTIDNFAVTAGQTYFIFISTWPTPQSMAYTLNVTSPDLRTSDILLPEISIYPNPANSKLFVNSPFPVQKTVIYNVSGQKVAEGVFSNQGIDVEKLPSGFYILEMQTESGRFRKNFIRS